MPDVITRENVEALRASVAKLEAEFPNAGEEALKLLDVYRSLLKTLEASYKREDELKAERDTLRVWIKQFGDELVEFVKLKAKLERVKQAVAVERSVGERLRDERDKHMVNAVLCGIDAAIVGKPDEVKDADKAS